MIGLLFVSSMSYAQQKVVLGEPILRAEEAKKELFNKYIKVCTDEFTYGELKNTVWIRGQRPFQFCHSYARYMTKDL